MNTCFVMQPFDGAAFDKRYEDVFVPAIRNAGLEPYRVDKDPQVSIPIQEIENGIRDSRVCLAEITLDNPNVWFELGFAIACGKEVVLVCSDERTTRFPFDIQHRTVITYTTSAPRDFERLGDNISERLKAILQKTETLTSISETPLLTKYAGLEHQEVMVLAAIAGNLEFPDYEGVTSYQIHRDLESNGFTKIAANLALNNLTRIGFIESGPFSDYRTGDEYFGYFLKDAGWEWVSNNSKRFRLRKDEAPEEDDIPI